MSVMQSLKSVFKEHAPQPLVDQARSAYHKLNRQVLNPGRYMPMPNARNAQFELMLSKLLRANRPVICVVGPNSGDQLPDGAKVIHADFDIGSPENIVETVSKENIDAFFVDSSSPRDLVNLVNLIGTYNLESAVLIGDKMQCRSQIGYVPFMPQKEIATSINVHNYFGRNYKITDTMLFQGSLYRGTRLIDCHQFLLDPDETKVIELEDKLDIESAEIGTYFLEAFHPALPDSTPELRYFGLYRDKDCGFMAGSHAIALGAWDTQLVQRSTGTRTYIPNLDGVTVRYPTPGSPVYEQGAEVHPPTKAGNGMVFTPSPGLGSLESVTSIPAPDDSIPDLEFDRIWPGIPIFGSNGFQTLWGSDRGLAIWHDGNSVRALGKSGPRLTPSAKGTGQAQSGKRQYTPPLSEELQEASLVSHEVIDLYESRVRFFTTTFPFLGHAYPNLYIVFDREQWLNNTTNFDVGLYTNNGTLVVSKPFAFNGTLQTVNLNTMFADDIAELSQGYWLITADSRNQGDGFDLAELQYPSNSMLFGFWSDGDKLYDSVHSLGSLNTVGYDLGLKGSSDAARRTGRIVSRTKKFAPLQADGDRSSWYWICNMGGTEELIDANIKLRVFGSNGQEGVSSFTLPARHARILNSDEVLSQCGVSCSDGTLWIEANECNVGGIWFLQSGDGRGFATDHFTGG